MNKGAERRVEKVTMVGVGRRGVYEGVLYGRVKEGLVGDSGKD